MSPEQARRRKIPVDHRTDVYSLGATMYEAICGRPPFRGKDHADTLSQIIEREPPEPRRANPRVPRDLETTVLQCLRKEAGERYGTAEALGQDLRRFARGDAIEARVPTRLERWSRRVFRHRKALTFGAVFFVLLLLLAVVEHGRRAAIERSRLAERRRVEATYRPAVLALLRRMQAAPLVLRVAAGEASGIFRFGDPRVPLVRADDFRSRSLGARAVARAARELEAVTRVFPEKRDAHYHLARAYALLGREDEARRALERALALDAGFLPARALAWQLDGGKDREAARESWLESVPDGWQRDWLDAWSSEPLWQWNRRVEAATTRLLALEQEPYLGCFVEAYTNRGMARLAAEYFAGAERDFVRVADRMTGLEPRLLLAKAYLEGARADEADGFLDDLWRSTPADQRDDVALWIATLTHSVWDRERALAWIEKISPERPMRDRLLCRFLSLLERNDEAITAGRRAVGSVARTIGRSTSRGEPRTHPEL